jgi:hypothetical protein
MPIALSDSQLEIIMRHAEPLQAADRSRYLHRVASLLHGQEIGDGAVARAARQAQSEVFRAPILHGIAGEPKHERKLQRRAPSAA